MKKLTLRQQRFVEEYPKDLNGMAAAVRAGYSTHTADRIAARLLNHTPHVRTAIKAKLEARAKRCEIKSDDVLRELDHVTHSDIAELVDEKTGCLKSVHAIPENARRAIASIEVEELFEKDADGVQVLKGYLRKVKFWDKNRAAELLAKHKGLLVERLEVKHEVSAREVHDSLMAKLQKRLDEMAASNAQRPPVSPTPIAQA